MKFSLSTYLALGCALLAGNANAAVTVNFSHPENYSTNIFSFGDYRNNGNLRVMEELHQHFNKLGTTLRTGQDLKVEI